MVKDVVLMRPECFNTVHIKQNGYMRAETDKTSQAYGLFMNLPGTWRQGGVFPKSNEDIDKACAELVAWAKQL